jgi:hypothetical protein
VQYAVLYCSYGLELDLFRSVSKVTRDPYAYSYISVLFFVYKLAKVNVLQRTVTKICMTNWRMIFAEYLINSIKYNSANT